MIYVRRRLDLMLNGILIPVKFGKHEELNEWRLAFQPDELDDQEYAVIVLDKDGEVYNVFNSIDLDYMSIEEYKTRVIKIEVK